MQKPIKTVCFIAALGAVTLLSGCSQLGVYKRDLAQGNLITEEMTRQLRPGMSQAEVVAVMGRPLLEAPFDASQWDYVFYLDEAYGELRQRRLTLHFDPSGHLSAIQRDGDFDGDIPLRAQKDVDPAAGRALPADDLPGPASGTLIQRPGAAPGGGQPAAGAEE